MAPFAGLLKSLTLTALLSLGAAAPTKPLQKRDTLPDYAITYAPITYLYSGEAYYPSDISVHLAHVQPEAEFVAIGANNSVNVNNLNALNSSVYLTASEKPSNNPYWITSGYGKPDASGLSGAPGTIIAVEKNETWTDVFYFHFYSYNYGGKVLGINFDDHVGDWEHVMIRFINSEPYAIYHSQHSAGSAYYWDVMTFSGSRPQTYVGNGGHANYATAGKQEYTVAAGIVTDTTDAGVAWDMTLNYRGYYYDNSTNTFTSAGGAGVGGTEQGGETADWLNWLGRWGDEQYPLTYLGQYCIFDECHYVTGPTGPVAKNLGRNAMCQAEDGCEIFDDINELTEQG
ncbi:hypothetical protein F5Y18DRAFT_149506 [Xylariaceae sp. FL1019]|nr:hypothetical protein F5Y18DRAFT_149506 [Xylariaceae sp. FL1019]